MRIIVDTFVLTSATTGIRTYCLELCEGLMALDQSEHEFRFPGYTFFRRNLLFGTRNHAWAKVANHLSYLLWKQLVLPIYVLFSRADAVLSPDYVLPVWPGRKGFVVYHDVFFWEYPAHYNKWWRKYYTHLSLASVNKQTVIVATSHYTKDKLRKLLFSDEPIEVVYQSPSAAHHSERQTSPPADQKPYLLHVGYYDKRKNLPVLIQAFAMLLREHPDCEWQLKLAGSRAAAPDLDDWDQVQELIHAHGLERRVEQLGFVASEVLTGLYQHTDAFIFPSYDEGFGIPIVEAMRYGLPVVVSDQGASREVLGEDAECIFQYDDPNALKACLQRLLDPGFRQTKSRRSLERARDFGREKFATDMVKMISGYA